MPDLTCPHNELYQCGARPVVCGACGTSFEPGAVIFHRNNRPPTLHWVPDNAPPVEHLAEAERDAYAQRYRFMRDYFTTEQMLDIAPLADTGMDEKVDGFIAAWKAEFPQ